MSDTTRLNVAITATDSAAQASIKALQTTVKSLEAQLAQLGTIAANASAASATAINRETAAIQAKIAALREEIATKAASSSAGIRAAQQEAEYINRNVDLVARKAQDQIRARNMVSQAEQRATLDAAQYEANSIAAGMSARERATRAAIAANNQRVYAERAAAEEKALAAQNASRIEAEYINRNADLKYAAMRAEADYMNRDFDLQARRSRVPVSAVESGGAGLIQRESRHVVGLFDSLARGQRGQAISSIGAAARDAGLGVGALATSMGVLLAIAGTATILRTAESMGKWATETRAAAAATGMSLQSYSALQGALSLVGVKADSADSTLRRLAVNLSTAIADPASKVAEAFHNLGINQDQLAATGGNTASALKLLADAFVRTADGANKSAAMSAIFGRGFEQIIPLLQEGSQGVDDLTQKAKALGTTLDEDGAAKLEAAGRAVSELGQHIRGDGISAMEAWSSVIIGTAHSLEILFSVLTKVASAIGTVGGFIKDVVGGTDVFSGKSFTDVYHRGLNQQLGITEGGDAAADAMRSRLGGGKTQVPPLTTPVSALDTMRAQMTQAALAASKGGNRQAEAQAEINVMKQTLATATLTAKQREQLQTELANKEIALNNEMASSGRTAAKQSYEDFASAEKLKLASAQSSSSAIKAIYEEWITAAIGKYKQLSSVVDELKAKELAAVNAAKRSEIMQGVRSDEAQARLAALDKQLAAFQGGTAPVRGQNEGPSVDIQRSRDYATQAQQVDAAYKAQIAALQQYGATTEQVVGIETQAKEKEVQLYQKAADAAQEAAKKIAEPFLQFFDQVGSQAENFTNSLIKALISPQIDLQKRGLTTVKTNERSSEISAALRSMLLDGIKSATDSVQQALGHLLANALSGGTANTIGQLLSNTLSKAFTSIFPSLASSFGGQAAGSAVSSTAIVSAVTAGATATTTGITAAIATSTASIIAAITAGAASTVGAVATSTVAETTATVAAGLNPSIFGFKAEYGGVVPSAAGGYMVGGGRAGTLSILHPEEMVLPAALSKGLQGLISRGTGGGPSNNATLNYAPTINTGARSRSGTGMTRGEFAQMLSLHSGSLLGEARNMIRNGWRPA